MTLRATVVAVLIAVLAPASAAAERAVGLIDSATLLRFDTSSPSQGTAVVVSGFLTPGETLIGIDSRPLTGDLIGVTVPAGSGVNAIARTYVLNPETGSATAVGAFAAPLAGLGDNAGDIDLNPRVDRIRVVQDGNENARINPLNGALSGNDTDLTFTPPAVGPLTAIAYDRNLAVGPTLTTLYGIDSGASRLVVQGSIDGSPTSPNAGVISSIGALGVTLTPGSDAGMDITPGGTAYAALRVASTPGLYTVNLTSGAATLVGALAGNVRSLAILPPDNCPSVAGDDQADFDGDGLGDACDPDLDGDGVTNAAEATRGSDPLKADTDGDGLSDGADACPVTASGVNQGCLIFDPPAPRDVTPPVLKVDRLATTAWRAAFLKGVSFRASTNEAAWIQVTLTTSARRGSVASAAATYRLTLVSKTFKRASGARTLTVKPSKTLVGRAGRFRVRVQIIATDAAGNRRTVTRTLSVRP